jgi:hypothetical protein
MSIGNYDPELAYNLCGSVAFHRKLAEDGLGAAETIA